MSGKVTLIAASAIAALVIWTLPASAAFSSTPMPMNSDGSSRFSDPDAAVDRMVDQMQGREWSNGSGMSMQFGSGDWNDDSDSANYQDSDDYSDDGYTDDDAGTSRPFFSRLRSFLFGRQDQ